MDISVDTRQRRCAYSKCNRTFDGRSDKRFCSDQCRNASGRQKTRIIKWKEPECIKQVDRILKRNYGILVLLQKDIITWVKKYDLLDRGFNFKFMTGIIDGNGGIKLYSVYDFGWVEMEEENTGIFKFSSVFNIDLYELPDFLKK